jgi:hypothetical protein
MKFKHVATYISKDAAEMYKLVTEAHGYKVRIIETPLRYGDKQYNVYQSREKIK